VPISTEVVSTSLVAPAGTSTPQAARITYAAVKVPSLVAALTVASPMPEPLRLARMPWQASRTSDVTSLSIAMFFLVKVASCFESMNYVCLLRGKDTLTEYPVEAAQHI